MTTIWISVTLPGKRIAVFLHLSHHSYTLPCNLPFTTILFTKLEVLSGAILKFDLHYERHGWKEGQLPVVGSDIIQSHCGVTCNLKLCHERELQGRVLQTRKKDGMNS